MPPKQPVAASMADPSAKEPLFGFLPRKVKAKQVQKALVSFLFNFAYRIALDCFFFYKEHNINPFTKLPRTQKYRNLLETRKKLAVFTHMDEFYKMVCNALHCTPLSREGVESLFLPHHLLVQRKSDYDCSR